MKQIAILLLCGALAAPATAETRLEPPRGEIGEGVDLLGEGARLFFRGLMGEMEPALRDMARALEELNWQGLGIADLDDYHPPEVLPNGDIMLRRKTPNRPEMQPGLEIEL